VFFDVHRWLPVSQERVSVQRRPCFHVIVEWWCPGDPLSTSGFTDHRRTSTKHPAQCKIPHDAKYTKNSLRLFYSAAEFARGCNLDLVGADISPPSA